MACNFEASRITRLPAEAAHERVVPSLEGSMFRVVQRQSNSVCGPRADARGSRFLCTVPVLAFGSFRGPFRERREFFAISVRVEFFGEGSSA